MMKKDKTKRKILKDFANSIENPKRVILKNFVNELRVPK